MVILVFSAVKIFIAVEFAPEFRLLRCNQFPGDSRMCPNLEKRRSEGLLLVSPVKCINLWWMNVNIFRHIEDSAFLVDG